MNADYIKISTILAVLLILPAMGRGHIYWTRANSIDPDCVSLYHIDDNNVTSGALVTVAAGLPSDRSLVIHEPGGGGATVNADVAQSLLYPYSFRFGSQQILKSDGLAGKMAGEDITGDLSIEAWFKWHSGFTSSSLVFGLTDGPKLQITYDPGNPANDRLGILTAPGDYRSAPQFVDWQPLIEHDGGIGLWSHAGLCIHSTGVTYNAARAQFEYNPGSLARFYINGHLVGDYSLSPVDISGMAVAETSSVIIECAAGSHTSFDEFTVWTRDWSENGENFGPFEDGRGSGTSSVGEWPLY